MWLKASGNQVSVACDELFLGQTAVLRLRVDPQLQNEIAL